MGFLDPLPTQFLPAPLSLLELKWASLWLNWLVLIISANSLHKPSLADAGHKRTTKCTSRLMSARVMAMVLACRELRLLQFFPHTSAYP